MMLLDCIVLPSQQRGNHGDATDDQDQTGLGKGRVQALQCYCKKGVIHPIVASWCETLKKSKAARRRFRKYLHTARFVTGLRFSESYLAVKGAALILPQSECSRTVIRGNLGDLQYHLQSMFYLLRPQDTIKIAVKLESAYAERNRYMVVVATSGVQDTEESIILGIDIIGDKATIGLVLPMWGDVHIGLDGDGGFSVTSNECNHIFKPVSVQAMWSALQSITKVRNTAHNHSYYPKGLTHTWVAFYAACINSDQSCVNEWNAMEDLESQRQDMSSAKLEVPPVGEDILHDKQQVEKLIKSKLKEVMMTVDLEEVTSKHLRVRLEEEMCMSLKDYRHFIDSEMIVILRQMDSPSEIFDYLYLGSEWNASNVEELKTNGVEYILNVTREIDNFFPGLFEYFNIRLYDNEQSELLKYWDNTYKFISRAKRNNCKVLVHCKMGVSRSASTVIAYAMKEYGWSLDEAFQHVKKSRSCIQPNSGFMKQLVTYQGILDASKQRHNKLWRSVSTGNLMESSVQQPAEGATDDYGQEGVGLKMALWRQEDYTSSDPSRPRSWSPQDGPTEILLKTRGLASGESSGEEQQETYEDMPIGASTPECRTLLAGSWDDHDLSSRSESMDELFSEAPPSSTDREVAQALSESDTGIVLLSYKNRDEDDMDSDSDSEDEHGGAAGGAVAGDSDPDYVFDQRHYREESGSYDISMLTGYEDELKRKRETPAEPVGADAAASGEYLHPDVQLEYMITQARKRRRITKLLMLSEAKREVERRKSQCKLPVVRCVSDGAHGGALTRVSSQPLLATSKVKPDDYWIKDIPPSPCSQDTGEAHPSSVEPDSEISEPSVPTSQEMTPITPTVQPESAPKAPVKEPDVEPTQESETVEDAEVDGKVTTPVVQQYKKEEIPWNPGTVKKQTLDLEEKIRTEFTVKEIQERVRRTSGGSSDSAGSSSGGGGGGGEKLINLMSSPMLQRKDQNAGTPKDDDNDISQIKPDESKDPDEAPVTSPPLSATGKGGTAGEETTEEQKTPPPKRRSPDGSPTAGSPRGSPGTRPVSHIYETEEIELEPGLVMRTKLEIEERERSNSFVEISPAGDGKPVQRSSSLRSPRPDRRRSKDRSSERRRTCLPVLTPSSSKETLLDDASASPGGTTPSSAEHYTIGDQSQSPGKVTVYVGSDEEAEETEEGSGVREESKSKQTAEGDDDKNGNETEEENVVYRIGDEKVEMEPDKVKRRTKDFEVITKEEQDALHSALLGVPMSGDRSRSQSPFVEESSMLIRRGSVRKQSKKFGGCKRTDGDTANEGDMDTDRDGEQDAQIPGEMLDKDAENAPQANIDHIVPNTTSSEVSPQVPKLNIINVDQQQPSSDVGAGSGGTLEAHYQPVPSGGGGPSPQDQPASTLAYPTEEEITWSVGTVRQHKQAYESINRGDGGESATAAKPSEDSEYRMSSELLTLIRQVGSALLDSPREQDSSANSEGSAGTPGQVKQIARQLENSSSRYFQKRLVIVEKSDRDSMDGSNTVVRKLDWDNEQTTPPSHKTSVTRSESLKMPMSSDTPEEFSSRGSVGRSSSFRESASPEKSSRAAKEMGDSHAVTSKTLSLSLESSVKRDEAGLPARTQPADTPEEMKVKELLGLFETVSKSASTKKDSPSKDSIPDIKAREGGTLESTDAPDSHADVTSPLHGDQVSKVGLAEQPNSSQLNTFSPQLEVDRSCTYEENGLTNSVIKKQNGQPSKDESCQGLVRDSLEGTQISSKISDASPGVPVTSSMVARSEAGKWASSRSSAPGGVEGSAVAEPMQDSQPSLAADQTVSEVKNIYEKGAITKSPNGEPHTTSPSVDKRPGSPKLSAKAKQARQGSPKVKMQPSEKHPKKSFPSAALGFGILSPEHKATLPQWSFEEPDPVRPRTSSDTSRRSPELPPLRRPASMALAAAQSESPSKERPSSMADMSSVGLEMEAAALARRQQQEQSSPQKSTIPNLIPMSPEREPDPATVPRRTRRSHGKSHPLSRLSKDAGTSSGMRDNPFYNTM